jgi:prepilin-type N-terminal cleavage/methylation domain-containing protein
MKKLFLKLKKGFSIAEVVIAIAVISIISVSAVTTVTLSVKNQQKNLRNHDIAITCDTVINCFRFAQIEGDLTFENLLKNANLVKEDEPFSNSIDRGSYILHIVVENGNKITLTAKDLSGNQLHEVSYEK